MAGGNLNVSLGANLEPLKKSIALVGQMMNQFAATLDATDKKMADAIRSNVAQMNAEMAKTTQAFDNFGQKGKQASDGAGAAAVSMRTQLRQATQEAYRLAAAFGVDSKEAIEAQKKVAALKDTMGDMAKRVESFNPDAKFKAWSQAIGGTVSIFTGIQGAMTAFGVKSEEAAQAMAKLQGLMALSQGLNALGEMKDTMGNLRAATLQMIPALKSMNAAMLATGIGVLVAGVAALAANWSEVKSYVTGANVQLDAQMKKAVELNEVEHQRTQIAEAQDNILKQQGYSERDILQFKIAQYKVELQTAQMSLDLLKQKNDEMTKSLGRTQGWIALLNSVGDTGLGKAISGLFGTTEKEFKDFSKQIKESELNVMKLQNTISGFELAISDIDNKQLQNQKKITEQKSKEYAKQLQEQQKLIQGIGGLYDQEYTLHLKKLEMDQREGYSAKQKSETINAAENQTLIEQQKRWDEEKKLNQQKVAQIQSYTQAISNAMQQAVSGIADLFADSLQSMFEGTFNAGETLARFFSFLAGVMKKLGTALLTTAVLADTTVKNILNGPVAIPAAIALIAAGAALGAYANSLKSTTAFADGGIVYGPTMGLVGEYQGASHNPEVIAPLDKLRSIIGNSGQSVQVQLAISGRDLRVNRSYENSNYQRWSGR